MKKFLVSLFVLIAIGGCTTDTSTIKKDENQDKTMKVLPIKWQRLVDEKGQTCERCESTGKEVEKAFQSLKESLAPLGIKVTFEEKALDPMTIAKDVSQSNRILVGKRPLEEWLDARVGKSPCGFCCAELGDDVECRTVEVDGRTYEMIPAELVVRAGLLAASQLLAKGPLEPEGETRTAIETPSSPCCPKTDSISKEIIDSSPNEPSCERETSTEIPSSPCCPK